MKKTVFFLTVLVLALTSCDSGDIVGGRYHGTFHNNSNNLREAGSLSFTYNNNDDGIYFLMNNLVPMEQKEKNKFAGSAGGTLLNDLLKTIPALDSLQVCNPDETITLMAVETEFKSSSVQTNITLTTTNENTVMVDFTGYLE